MSNDDAAHRDGNVLAGPLSEVFAADVTVAVLSCAACGRAGRLAELPLYDRAPGAVLRCPACGEVMARAVRTDTELWLDLRGSASLRLPVPGG